MRDEISPADVLGTGWHFPVATDVRGSIRASRHERDIEESMCIILTTAKGERRMRPEFGCGVHDLIFAPNNATTWGLVRQHVQEALGRWEPRVEVNEVRVEPDATDRCRLLIDIKYQVRATSEERSLVYPFYLNG
jgi:phage baseplate assembly protein W